MNLYRSPFLAWRESQAGVSLLSVLIALAIVGILVSIAAPGYGHFFKRDEIRQAKFQLLRWQAEQLRYRLSHSQFATKEALSIPVEGSYLFTVSDVDQNNYTLLASRSEAQNDGCDILTVLHSGEKTPAKCW